MNKPKAQKINLPYASTVASYFGDQGSGPGNSFLGRFFKKSVSPMATPTASATGYPQTGTIGK